MEAMIEWEQTTPAHFDSDSSTPLLETSIDPEEDPKEDPKEDPEPVEDKCNAPQSWCPMAPHYGTSHNSLVGQNPPPVRTLRVGSPFQDIHRL